MLIENEFVHRVNGIPLYYIVDRSSQVLHQCTATKYDFHVQASITATPPYTPHDFLMSKVAPTNSPFTLTPPISPLPEKEQFTRRESVIMKVENCQIITANEGSNSLLHVCRWENCYRWEENSYQEIFSVKIISQNYSNAKNMQRKY